MVTGASTAELVVILVDARNGVVEQTRRHAAVAALLRRPARGARRQQDGPGRLRRAGLRRDRRRSSPRTPPSSGVPEVTAIPISALDGDNVVTRPRAWTGTRGPTRAGAPGDRPGQARPDRAARAASRCST